MNEYLYTLLRYVAFPLSIFFLATPLLLPAGWLFLPPAAFWCLLALYLGTTVWASREARRLRFPDYELFLIRGGRGAFYCCLLCWHVCFPVFLRNRRQVKKGVARPRSPTEPEKPNDALKALLVIQAYALFASAAIPGCLPSQIRVNEEFAVAALKRYGTAQVQFQRARAGATPGLTAAGRGYCDNFRNLHYGPDPKGKPLRLIDKDFADAFGRPAPATGGASGESVPRHGYVFVDDPYLTERRLWDAEYGLFAVPAQPGKTGWSMFWIGKDDRVLRHNLPVGEETPTVRPEDSPFHPGAGSEWLSL